MEDFDLNTYKWNDKTALSQDALRLISTKAIDSTQEASGKPVLPSTFIKNRKKFLMKEVQLPMIVDEKLENSKIVDIGFIEVKAVVSNDAKSEEKEPNISSSKESNALNTQEENDYHTLRKETEINAKDSEVLTISTKNRFEILSNSNSAVETNEQPAYTTASPNGPKEVKDNKTKNDNGKVQTRHSIRNKNPNSK